MSLDSIPLVLAVLALGLGPFFIYYLERVADAAVCPRCEAATRRIELPAAQSGNLLDRFTDRYRCPRCGWSGRGRKRPRLVRIRATRAAEGE